MCRLSYFFFTVQSIVTFGGSGGGVSSAGMMRLLAERVLVQPGILTTKYLIQMCVCVHSANLGACIVGLGWTNGREKVSVNLLKLLHVIDYI